MDILAHPSDPGMTAWFTTATGDDLNDTLERAAHQALTGFYERHLPGVAGTTVALFPIQNVGNTVWSECLAAVGDPEHMNSMFQEVAVTSAYQHRRLEEDDHQVSTKNRLIKDI
jgi:hypothetical protein